MAAFRGLDFPMAAAQARESTGATPGGLFGEEEERTQMVRPGICLVGWSVVHVVFENTGSSRIVGHFDRETGVDRRLF